jgi:hypothetical protein
MRSLELAAIKTPDWISCTRGWALAKGGGRGTLKRQADGVLQHKASTESYQDGWQRYLARAGQLGMRNLGDEAM